MGDQKKERKKVEVNGGSEKKESGGERWIRKKGEKEKK